MIKSFKCKDTEKLFNDRDVKRFRNFSRKVRIKLEMLNATVSLDGLKVPPGNRLEALKGDRKGQYSIRTPVNGKKDRTHFSTCSKGISTLVVYITT